jgi:hypothetical protein
MDSIRIEHQNHYNQICILAVRYALGSGSYIPGLVCDFLSKNLDALTKESMETMIDDISSTHSLGPDFNETTWLRFRNVLQSKMEDTVTTDNSHIVIDPCGRDFGLICCCAQRRAIRLMEPATTSLIDSFVCANLHAVMDADVYNLQNDIKNDVGFELRMRGDREVLDTSGWKILLDKLLNECKIRKISYGTEYHIYDRWWEKASVARGGNDA